jgi:CHRD domain
VNRRRIQLVLVFGVASLLAAVGVAIATNRGSEFREKLTGYEEVNTVSTPANGEFKARVSRFSEKIEYRLSYRDFETDVTQAHIHFGARATNGGVVVFLCSNLPNPPAGTPPCPVRGGTVSGELGPEDVGAGAAAQGITTGEFDELVDAMRAEVTYANVHSTARPPGEIRAQLENDHRDW